MILQAGNRMVGRLYTMRPEDGSPQTVSEVYVHIIREDRLVGPPIPVNREGVFEVELVDGPGPYSIVAAGSGGFGACSFYARRGEEPAAAPSMSVSMVSQQLAQAAGNPLAGGAPPASPYQITLSLVSDPAVVLQAFPAADAPPDAGSSAAGGGFGGDAGPSGGGAAPAAEGRVAGGLLAGGLAAGITALAVGDQGQPLVSPFAP